MFDPGGKAKITMQGANGDTYEMDGYVSSIDMEVDHGMETSGTVEFIASGPVTLKSDFEPDPIPPAPVGKFVVLPEPAPDIRELPGPHALGYACRIFEVTTNEVYRKRGGDGDPTLVANLHVEIGDEHPQVPRMRACRIAAVERISPKCHHVAVWYERSPQIANPLVIHETPSALTIGLTHPPYRPWSWEACVIAATLPPLLVAWSIWFWA